MIASPFNLQTRSSIYASVVAYNAVGDSPVSDVGNGAIVLVSTVPDPPRFISRNPNKVLDMTRISIIWEDGISDGNQPILDYRVSFDQGTDMFVVSDSHLTVKEFTQALLTPGVTYSFRIEARNIVGYSDYSISVDFVAA